MLGFSSEGWRGETTWLFVVLVSVVSSPLIISSIKRQFKRVNACILRLAIEWVPWCTVGVQLCCEEQMVDPALCMLLPAVAIARRVAQPPHKTANYRNKCERWGGGGQVPRLPTQTGSASFLLFSSDSFGFPTWPVRSSIFMHRTWMRRPLPSLRLRRTLHKKWATELG